MWDISVSSLRGACAELRDTVNLGIRVVHCWVCILLYAFFPLPRNSSTDAVPRPRWECWAHQSSSAGVPCLAIFAVFCSSTTIPNQITPSIHNTPQFHATLQEFHGTFTELILEIAIQNLSLRLWGPSLGRTFQKFWKALAGTTGGLLVRYSWWVANRESERLWKLQWRSL
jgi:hypothetical protein